MTADLLTDRPLKGSFLELARALDYEVMLIPRQDVLLVEIGNTNRFERFIIKLPLLVGVIGF